LDIYDVKHFLPWIIWGYMFGSCPTGYILVRLLRGEDIRRVGSGGTGATNVSRALGRGWGVFTAAADMLKGGAAMLAAILSGHAEPALLSLIGTFSVIGHNYPVWIGFRGGKGVATSFGVIGFFDFFNPLPAILGGIVWLAVREASRMVSVASMAALGAAALFAPVFDMPRAYFVCGLFLFVLSVWRHRDNIKRVAAGNENRVKPLFSRRGEKTGNQP
jgi:glycerol-3-phosphate acyltransferase PlsY